MHGIVVSQINKCQLAHYVKNSTYRKEKSRKWREDPTRVQNWYYDANSDEYICGMCRRFVFMQERQQKSENGYISRIRVYECENCDGCPHRERCVKSERPGADRSIYVNRRLSKLRRKARENLDSETGRERRSQRPVGVESVFGDIKGNCGVRRFLSRGLEKVKTE